MTDNNTPPLLKFPTRLAALLIVLTVVVGIDQASKLYAETVWKDAPQQLYFGGLFRIDYEENHGAFLSLLADHSAGLRFWVLTVGNAIALLGIGVYVLVSRRLDWFSLTPLVLLLAGGVGNLIDRVRLGYVVDFFWLGVEGTVFKTGIFNVADMAITLAFLLLVRAFFLGEAGAVKNAGEFDHPLAAAPEQAALTTSSS